MQRSDSRSRLNVAHFTVRSEFRDVPQWSSRQPGDSSRGLPRFPAFGRLASHMENAQTFWLAAILFLSLLKSAVASENDNVLLDFTAKWCGPCQQMSSTVSKLERAGYPIRKVDVDQEPSLASRFGVQSIPCFVLIANGKEIDRISGFTDEKHLVGMLNRLPKPSKEIANSEDSQRKGSNPATEGAVGLGKGITIGKLGALDGKRPGIGLPPIFGGKNHERDDRNAAPRFDENAIARSQNPEEDSPRGGSNANPNANGPVDPLMASVRLKVIDAGGINFGSGTIIDSRPGRAVILTCGHIFRKAGTDSKVEVEIFNSNPNAQPESLAGQVMHFDLDADVGVLIIKPANRLPVIKLASAQTPALKERLYSIGCSGGDAPSREEAILTAINKYAGPENLECSGMPQQGRSGGGLFCGQQQVGICIAADPKEKRGIYAGMKPIAQLLDKIGMGHLAPTPMATEGLQAGTGIPNQGTSNEAVGSMDRTANERATATAAIADDISQFLRGELGIEGSVTADDSPQDYEGAEIICIVRPKTPGTPSRVVIVNQASGRFIGDLLHESTGHGDRATARRESTTADPTPNGIANIPSERSARQVAPVSTPNNIRQASAVRSNQPTRPIETSFEPQPYRRKRD